MRVRTCIGMVLDAGDDADVLEWTLIMRMVARAFERIGDNAVDIGEQTAFVVRACVTSLALFACGRRVSHGQRTGGGL